MSNKNSLLTSRSDIQPLNPSRDLKIEFKGQSKSKSLAKDIKLSIAIPTRQSAQLKTKEIFTGSVNKK